jgi:glycosyltransferase involved in cell wall biosynthesis
MKKIKFAFLSYTYLGINPYGASVYVQQLLKILAVDDRFEVDFYCPYPRRDFEILENINYIHIKTSKFPLMNFLSFAYKLAKKIKKIDYDIIHSNIGAGLLLKNVDFETFHHYEHFSFKDFFVWLNYKLVHRTYQKAKYIFTGSEQGKNELIEIEKIKPEQIIQLNYYVNTKDFNTENIPNDLREEYATNNEKLLLSIGLLLQRKNPLLSLKTLKFLKEKGLKSKLLMIGSGELKNTLVEYSKQEALEKDVIFIDYVDDTKPFYKIADLLLTPSKLEGFGYLYLEGPACGCRFVGFDTGIAKLAAENNLGKISTDDTEFVELVYKTLLEESSNREAIGKNALQFIEKYFSYNNFKEKMLIQYINHAKRAENKKEINSRYL